MGQPVPAPALGSMGRWQLPVEAMRAVPAAVETDVYRSLTVIPAVTFTTPLSARPLVRGYSAGESSFRIDGFEVVNLYHLGRIFSAFPAEATDQVTVTTAPHGPAMGTTLSGIVDVTGRSGPGDATHGGATISLASASGWVGGGTDLRWLAAARAVHISGAELLGKTSIPYDFQDAYASASLLDHGRTRGRLTAFASRDHLFDSDLGSGMDWSNALLGARWQVLARGGLTIDISGSATQFIENVVNLEARRSRIDAQNRFSRIGASSDATFRGSNWQVSAGASLGRRSIGNRLTARTGDDFPRTAAAFDNTELGGYVELTRAFQSTVVQVGTRVDAAGSKAVWAPRLRVAQPLWGAASLGMALGRTSQLFHVVSDPQSEPDLAFYDFWFSAGENGVPTPIVDHVAIDVNLPSGAFTGRASAFGSSGKGLVELRPLSEQSGGHNPFRFGRSRTRGLEAQIVTRGSLTQNSAFSASYVLSWSDREWNGTWVPWSQDRRHVLRLLGQRAIGSRWSLSAAFEAGSGVPLTPVEGVAVSGTTNPDNGGIDRTSDSGEPVYIFGAENSHRSGGTARGDLGVNFAFRGPWKSRMWAGVSILNVGFGPVSPLTPVDPQFNFVEGETPRGAVSYKRLFDLPAIPTLTLRMQF